MTIWPLGTLASVVFIHLDKKFRTLETFFPSRKARRSTGQMVRLLVYHAKVGACEYGYDPI